MDIWERYQAIEHDIEIELRAALAPHSEHEMIAGRETANAPGAFMTDAPPTAKKPAAPSTPVMRPRREMPGRSAFVSGVGSDSIASHTVWLLRCELVSVVGAS